MTTHQTSFGKYLKTERNLRNISIEDIASATKIKPEFLNAIEQDEFDRLPNETFVKGYIRAYARYCGMNEDEVLVNYEFFDQLQNGPTPVYEPDTDDREPLARSKWLFYCMLMILTIGISFLFAYFLGYR